jgi:hypothetical protein
VERHRAGTHGQGKCWLLGSLTYRLTSYHIIQSSTTFMHVNEVYLSISLSVSLRDHLQCIKLFGSMNYYLKHRILCKINIAYQLALKLKY